MMYQALLGALPLSGIDENFVKRSIEFTIKAAREGKEQTSWYAPNERYEENLKHLVMTLLCQRRSAEFLSTFVPFAHRCALLGALNSLSQLVLKMTMPGIPDLYQGSEFWDLSYVDPDNRRPVDFGVRQHSLRTACETPDWPSLVRDWQSGELKLALTHALLALRRRFGSVFLEGRYRPIEVSGPDRNDVIAYARLRGKTAIVVAAGRFFARATANGTTWPEAEAWNACLQISGLHRLEDVLSGEKFKVPSNGEVPIGTLFHTIPIAILQTSSA
jgi:(1->4)-alpha-D-glucan 1-alpha-D-glucosylmutase